MFGGDWVIGISGSLIWSETLIELIFNPCGEFGEVRRAQLAKPTLHLHAGAPGIFSDLLRSLQMLKKESGARKATRSYRTYSSLVKLQPEFAVENLPLGRTAVLMPEFAVKDLPLGRTV